jgi:hypothetical protein
VALVPIWKLNLKVGALPDLPTATPGALPLMATLPPGMSVVTLTLTELPGRRVADPGLTPVIAARAGTAVKRMATSRAAAKRTSPARDALIRRPSVDLPARTFAPSVCADDLRLRRRATTSRNHTG